MSTSSRPPPRVVVKIARSLFLMLFAGFLAGQQASAASAGASACREGTTRLCLLDRFEVEATWQDQGGRDRVALTVPVGSSATGAFSFFGGEDADLLVRVVGTGRESGRPVIEAGAVAGIGFELRVLDTTSGAEWIHTGRRSDVATDRLAAEVLEAGGGDRLDPDHAKASGECGASATDLCSLGGRFRVTARTLSGDRRAEAWARAGRGETGLFSATERGDAELVVRVVDGRAVNGHVWLLYSAISTSDLEIEIADLATGNSRRFVKDAGGPASEALVEALSASATVAHVTLDASRARTRVIGPLGGSIQATDAQGTRFVVAFPPQALAAQVGVTVTPVAAIAGLPFSGGLKAGVRIEPEGLIPAESVLLTITPATAVPPAQQLTFAFRGLAGELFLSPPRARQAAIIVPVHRLGGYGLAAGSAADLSAQLLRLPSRQEDRFSQRLAGLLLPLRRAGNMGPLPASVLQLLQAEFTTGIKPKLGQTQEGLLRRYLPLTWNFRNTVQDTGLTLKLAGKLKGGPRRLSPLEQLNKWEINQARLALAKNLAACSGSGGAAAAIRAYNNYSVLKHRRALAPTDTTKLLNCLRFELRFDTGLQGDDGVTYESHTVEQLVQPLSLNLAEGYFYGKVLAPQKASLSVKDCDTRETGRRDEAVFTVDKLLIANLGWFELDELVAPLATEVLYRIWPLPLVHWIETCDGVSDTYDASWLYIYGFLHDAEVVGDDGAVGISFRSILWTSADPRKFAERLYERSEAFDEDRVFSEDTFFFVLHTPLK